MKKFNRSDIFPNTLYLKMDLAIGMSLFKKGTSFELREIYQDININDVCFVGKYENRVRGVKKDICFININQNWVDKYFSHVEEDKEEDEYSNFGYREGLYEGE